MTAFPQAILLSFCLAAHPAPAQQTEAAQDPQLDNLVHAIDYRTAAPGTLGAVVEHGDGPIDMVLVSGFGVGASAFADFQQRNEKRYHMLAVTLPGFEGTAAPPMPKAGTSYGDQTWTRAAVLAVVDLIEQRKLQRPVLVGHFLNGTQVAARVAIDHPDRVRALVLLASSPRFEPQESTPQWPKGLTLAKKIAAVDGVLAPRWFKTVTRKTWVAGNFVASDWSVDEVRGGKFATLANEPPLPVLIRWLCEFHASDLRPDLAESKMPLLLIQPSFTAALRADQQRSYLASFFAEPWQGMFADRPHTETMRLEDAGILVMDDKAAEVDAALAKFLERHAP
jgi:pimeloyl-[acyl-carrier protein] methyl ester esterase